jgi:hypothetical protein
MSKAKKRLNIIFLILCIIGVMSSMYLVVSSLIKQDWGEAFVSLAIGFLCVNPLYQGIKRNK